MQRRGPSATLSGMLPRTVVCTVAMVRTSLILQSVGVLSRSETNRITSVLCWFRSAPILALAAEGLQIGKHQQWVAKDVTIVNVPEVC